MNNLAGKKVLCFIALPHHNRFLVPIMEALAAQGMEVGYFTAAAEGAFEITLNQAGLPYRHVLDYATDETKLRVNDGMRELRLVLQPKILANAVMQSVPLVIQDKTIRAAVENFHGLERMLEVEKPDLLFALHELNPWGKILGYLSHRHKIPYFTLQEGLYYADTHYYRFHTDYSTACLVWGEECREILRRAGCADDKIYGVGNTHIWNAKKHYCDPASVAQTRQALGIGADKKLILFLMSYSNYRPFEAGIFRRWLKDRGDIVAAFKWHPATGTEVVDRAMENLRGQPSILNVGDIDTYAAIGASEVCVTVGNSTTGLEALAFGKPLIEVRLPDQQYSYFERKVADMALGFDDISPKIETALSGTPSPKRASVVENYLSHNFACRDGQTMPRIVGLVKESLRASASAGSVALPLAAPTRYPCTIVLPVDDGAPQSLLATLAGIVANTAAELFEIIIVNCARAQETAAILAELGGDLKIIEGTPEWSYAEACNRAVSAAEGKYLVFWKPGLIPVAGWLDGLISVAEENRQAGVIGGLVLNKNGLIWHLGAAFDVNQTPFSIYRLMPREFAGAAKQREFKAVEFPFMVARDLFGGLGGFNLALRNRFDDIDFCLRVKRAGLSVIYTPTSKSMLQSVSWQAPKAQDELNRIRFFSAWTGSLWQDDGVYLQQDSLSHDALSAIYRDIAGRLAVGAGRMDQDSSPALS